ncbi:MAG: DUF3251 domain-containing protein, partial [Betaproteobacteria bacterium]
MNLRVIALFLSFLVAGCDGGVNIQALEARVAALEQENKSLKSQVDSLGLQFEVESFEKFAFMRPGDDGYSPVRFDLGVLTVRLADVKPYANGSKITLNFGNLTSARINGLRAKLDWGKVDEKGVPLNDKAKSRNVTFEQALVPGSWTNVDLVLEGIPPAEL